MLYQILLPSPPPLSACFLTDFRTKRRFKGKRYVQWEDEVKRLYESQDKVFFTTKIKLMYQFGRYPDRRRRDFFNLEKALSDSLKANGIIEDDSLFDLAVVMWTKKVECGKVLVTLTEAEDEDGEE